MPKKDTEKDNPMINTKVNGNKAEKIKKDKNDNVNKNKNSESNNKKKKQKNKKITKTNILQSKSTPIIIGIVIITIIIISVIFALININNEKIFNNVSIMGIDVSNLTQEEAKKAVNDVVNSKLNEDLVLKKDDYETSINANQINATFDVEAAVNKAYNIGRDGNILTNNYGIIFTTLFGKNIDCNLNYSNESLDKKIDDVSSKLPGALVDNSYYIDGEELIIVKGKEGLQIQKNTLKDQIINSIKNVNSNYNIITIPTENVKPDSIDLNEIKNEIYKEPQNAYITENPTTVHADVEGVDFKITMEEAEKLLSENDDECVIPLKITKPDKTLEDLGKEAFPNKLATYSTRYDPSNKNRSNNVEISTKKIDGTILMPGETFSYNQTVGERTISEGYKEAGAYAGGKVVQDVGGGICQTSSTLYNVALLANLEIVDRTNHQFLTSYVSAGRDATVTWGGIDFKFKNTRSYPIKIEAKAKNGVCSMTIYGIKEDKEYEVTIQSVIKSYIPYTTKYENDASLEKGEEVVEQAGYTGCTSEAYRILKLNGEVVSKTLLSKDTYDPMTRIIRRGTK
jgi:vancomycin resistance protein YoaR